MVTNEPLQRRTRLPDERVHIVEPADYFPTLGRFSELLNGAKLVELHGRRHRGSVGKIEQDGLVCLGKRLDLMHGAAGGIGVGVPRRV